MKYDKNSRVGFHYLKNIQNNHETVTIVPKIQTNDFRNETPTEKSLYTSNLTWKFVMLGVCIVWSTNFAVVKSILDSMPHGKLDPPIYATLRFSLASLALLPRAIKYYKFENIDLIKNGCFLGLFNFMGYYGQSVGLQTSTANKSAFICSMVVVWVAFVTSFKDKTFKPQTWLSVLFATVGAGIIELNGVQLPVLGDLWLFLQPIGFGTGYILIENLMKKYPNDAAAITSLRLLTVTFMSFLWSLSIGHTMQDFVDVLSYPQAIVGLCYTGFFTTAMGLWVSAIAFKKVPATEASIILSLEPIFAIISASSKNFIKIIVYFF
jgi:drug/metabolite transporter (DMT)-like permease